MHLDSEKNYLTIQELANLAGISTSALRAWERRFAIFSPVRTQGGHRLYTYEDLKILWYVRRLQSSGKDLREISSVGRAILLEKALQFFSETHGLEASCAESHDDDIVSCLETWDLSSAIKKLETLNGLTPNSIEFIGLARKFLAKLCLKCTNDEVCRNLMAVIENFIEHLLLTRLLSEGKNLTLTAICVADPNIKLNLDLFEAAFTLHKVGYQVLYLDGFLSMQELAMFCLRQRQMLLCLLIPQCKNDSDKVVWLNDLCANVVPHVVTLLLGDIAVDEANTIGKSGQWKYIIPISSLMDLEKVALTRRSDHSAALIFVNEYLKRLRLD